MLIYIFIFLSINTNKQYRYIFPCWQFTIQNIFIYKDKGFKIALYHFHPRNVSRGDEIFRYEIKKKKVEYEKRMLKYMYIANLNTMLLSLKTEGMKFFLYMYKKQGTSIVKVKQPCYLINTTTYMIYLWLGKLEGVYVSLGICV